MILAGIDEAGYGPLLGPLVVGCCAFELEDQAPEADLPCLWKRLRRVASKTRDKTGRKIHVNDSKLVYSPSAGLKELERSVLALAQAGGIAGDHLDAFVGQVAGHVLDELREYPWYAALPGETFPLDQNAPIIRTLANSISAEMLRTRTRLVHLAARVVPERQLNRMLDATRNKGSALFSIAAIHLDYLLKTFGQQGLVIFCDRQGGREHYGQLLRLMFEEWALEVTAEADGYSEYRLTNGQEARVIFCEKAETRCMSVALASMLSKYLREALMRRFNAWWAGHLPGIQPTAGYYNDGLRFLKDIELKRAELGIRDEELVRGR